MLIKLGTIDLALGSKDDGKLQEKLRSILSISIKDKRNLVEHRIPGLSGNQLQDSGREPAQISIEGEIYGEDASETIKEIYSVYEAGESLPFHSDLTAIADINKVTIENVQVNKSMGTGFHYGYRIDLKEEKG
jgi:DNA circularisation protein N-terminus